MCWCWLIVSSAHSSSARAVMLGLLPYSMARGLGAGQWHSGISNSTNVHDMLSEVAWAAHWVCVV